jgi:hypothetical protein
MKSDALSRIAICVIGAGLCLTPTPSTASGCKCPKPPGGGVQCTDNQIAKCDPRDGECNCSCVSVERQKTTAEYEAVILSSVLKAEISATEVLNTFRGVKFSEDKHGVDEKDDFTISVDFSKLGPPKGEQVWNVGGGHGVDLKGASQVKVGLPGWLGEALVAKGGVSVGPGASLQNCTNGICIGGDNNGTATVINEAPKAEFTAAMRPIPSDKPGYLETEIRVTPNIAIPPPVEMVLDFDSPVVQIGGWVEGAAAGMLGGPFRYGTHTLSTVQSPGISPRYPMLLRAYSLKPLNLVRPPYLEGQN